MRILVQDFVPDGLAGLSDEGAPAGRHLEKSAADTRTAKSCFLSPLELYLANERGQLLLDLRPGILDQHHRIGI